MDDRERLDQKRRAEEREHADDTVDGAPSSPGVADPIQLRTDDIQYPTWQPELRAVMLEIEPAKVREKVAVAEAAMAKRRQQLTDSRDHAELRAMKAEGEAMKLALDKILSEHPDLDK